MDWENFRLSRRLRLERAPLDTVYALIAEIDAVKLSWQMTARIRPQYLSRLTQSIIITSSGASNRIEGNRLTDAEVENVYRNFRIKKFKTRDEQEVAGYLEVLSVIFENYNAIQIRESTILQLHQDMLEYTEKDTRHRGQYKFGSNRVEIKDQSGQVLGIIFDPTPPHLVQKEMQELIGWYDWAIAHQFKHPLILIANMVFEYLAIHPFQDGNGRTSRLLTNLMLLHHGYAFTSLASHEKIIEDNKADYYRALNKTQSTWKTTQEDLTPWLLFFLNVVKTQALKALHITEEDTIEHLLSPKQLLVWQWIQSNPYQEFSRKDAVLALQLPERTVEQTIKKFLDMKKLQRLGQGKATRYRLIS